MRQLRICFFARVFSHFVAQNIFKNSGPVHTNAFSFENAYFFYLFSPSVHTNRIENGGVCLRKRRFSITLSRVEVFENGGSASLCGRAKTEVFENDYVTGIGMSQLKKQNGCFLIRFRLSKVKNAAKPLVWTKNFLSVFKKLKTEAFENALVWTGPQKAANS